MQVTPLPQHTRSSSSEVACRDSHDPHDSYCTTKLHQQDLLDAGLMVESSMNDL